MKAESKAEKRLARDVALGKQATIPKSWKKAERTIRGDFLAAMMLGEARDGDGETVAVHKRGLLLKGAVIEGSVDIAGVRDPAGDALLPALQLTDCDMLDGLDFSHSRIARFRIEGGTAGDINGSHAHVAGVFGMQRGKYGALSLAGAMIDKSLFLDTDNTGDANTQTHFSGLVCLISTVVDGNVSGLGGRFDRGIDLTNAKVTGGVHLRTDNPEAPFMAGAEVALQGATIGGAFEGVGGRFEQGINAQGAKIGGAVLLRAGQGRPFVARGRVDFLGAAIKGGFDGQGGWFLGKVEFYHSRIDGTVKFGVDQGIPSIADISINARNATIGGDLVLTGGIHSWGLDMRGAVVAGRFETKGFWRVEDEPDTSELLKKLASARDTDTALFTDDLEGEAAEKAGLVAAAPYEYADQLIKQKGIDVLPERTFDLTDARVGTLADHPLLGWPGPEGRLKLNGFRYDRVELVRGEDSRERWRRLDRELPGEFSRRVRGGKDAEGALAPMWQRRLMWLRHQFPGATPTTGAFHPQPYEQLARTLRAMGHGSDADQIAYEKRLYRVTCKVDGWWSRLGRRFLNLVSKHGYSPGRSFFSLAVYIGLGTLLAHMAVGADQFVTAAGAPKGTWITQFQPLLYAIDVATPFIEFGPEGSFAVAPEAPWWFGLGHMVYRLMGWVLVSITIFTLTGLMRRD